MTKFNARTAAELAQAILINQGTVTAVRQDEAYQVVTVTYPNHDARMAVHLSSAVRGIALEPRDGTTVEVWFPHSAGDLIEVLNRPYRVRLTNTKTGRVVALRSFACPAAAAQYMFQAQRKMYDMDAKATAPDAKGGRRWITRQALGKLYTRKAAKV